MDQSVGRSKALMVGHRESAIILAESTYLKAARNHFFDVEADMAAILSRQYSQFMADETRHNNPANPSILFLTGAQSGDTFDAPSKDFRP